MIAPFDETLSNHEAHEGHEGFIHFILLNFVLFAIFVVKCLFLLWLRLGRAEIVAVMKFNQNKF